MKCSPKIYFPNTEDEMQLIVSHAQNNNKMIRIVGSGHSFTKLVKTDQILISLDDFTGLLNVDKTNRLITVKAGTTINQIGKLIGEYDLALLNQGDIDKQTIAGAISTGTHGTGINYGNLSTQIVSLRLLTGRGDFVNISKFEDPELFRAASVSLGSLGIITTVTLNVGKRRVIKSVRDKSSLEKVKLQITELHEDSDHFEFYWFPYTDTVQLKTMSVTDDPPKDSRLFRFINDILLENIGLGFLLTIAKYLKFTAPTISKIIAALVSRDEEINYSNKVYATPRLVKFNEMEYSVPAEEGLSVLEEIKSYIENEKIKVAFPIEFRYVKGDNNYLSPMFKRNTATISIHLNKGMDYERYFRACEQIFLNYDGRPHWGKIHYLNYKHLSKLYPKWEDFIEFREKLDPDNIFLNDYLRNIFGIE